jgi:hypothetical protein
MAVAVNVWTANVEASCLVTAETVVRGRFVRCEEAQFYWDASGGDAAVLASVERELGSDDTPLRNQRRARLLEGLPDPLGPPAKFVVVVSREWQVSTTPWQPPAVSTTVELVGPPQELRETVRYLWRGPPEACETTPAGSYVDLWIIGPCCDTPILTGGACLMQMSYAEPAPAPLRKALASVLP